MSLDQQSLYYDARWKEENRREKPPNPARVQLIIQRLQKIDEQRPIKSILDVGCGNGWVLQAISEAFPDCMLFGIEPSAVGCSNSAARVENANIKCGTLDQVEFDQRFDAVVCSEVLEHVSDQDHLIMQLAEMLDESGTLVMTTPNDRFRNTFFVDTTSVQQPLENWITREQLSEKLRCYFNSVDVSTFDSSYWLARHQRWKATRNQIMKIKGGWRLAQGIDAFLCRRPGIGLYLIAVASKNRSDAQDSLF